MGNRFDGKLVLVAGGTGALGRAVSAAFLAELARVVVTYRSEEEFSNLRRAAGAQSAELEGHLVDVTNEPSVTQFVSKVLSDHGHIDVLVNAVGAYAGGTPLWELDSAVFEQMLSLNLRAAYVLCRAVVPAMLNRKAGAILNVASRSAFDHAAGASAYAASKAAAVALIDSLAADLEGMGVRANSILPSVIDTEANRKAMPNANFRGWPKPEEIARVVLFLCSDEARLIHGAAVPVYGDA